MKLKVERGRISFEMSDLVDSLSQEDRRELARYVAADSTLFAAVLECVTSEGRFGRFFTEDSDGDWWFDNKTLLELREKLIPLMPQVARGAVEEALRQRNVAKAEERRFHDWAWKLFHAWPEDRWQNRPRLPDYARAADPSAAEVDALVAVPQPSTEGEKK